MIAASADIDRWLALYLKRGRFALNLIHLDHLRRLGLMRTVGEKRFSNNEVELTDAGLARCKTL